MLRQLYVLPAALLLFCSFSSAYTPNEQALLQFAATLTNFDDVYLRNNWTGWGKDNSTLCPSVQTDVVDSLLCQPDYPGSINASSQSWTGVVCTPNDTVLCLNLPSWNLAGSTSALEALVPLQDLQVLNLANNSLQGSLPASLPSQLLDASATGAVSLGFLYLSNNSISGTIPALWGDSDQGWQQALQGLYLDQNELTGQLPTSWSDTNNSFPNLGRVDFFLNQLSGPLTWNAANMPGLGNLVLLPGNEMCGSVPQGFEGIVRSYSTMIDGTQILPNVTQLGRACPNKRSLSHGAIAGGVIAAVAAAVMAAFLCYLCFRQVVFGSSNSKPAAAKPGWLWSLRAKRQQHLHEVQQPAFTASKLESLPSSSSDINLLSNQARSHVQGAADLTAGQLTTSAV